MYNQPGTNDNSQTANNDTARTDHGVLGAWTAPDRRPVTNAAQTTTAPTRMFIQIAAAARLIRPVSNRFEVMLTEV